jgi:hypothetical protein
MCKIAYMQAKRDEKVIFSRIFMKVAAKFVTCKQNIRIYLYNLVARLHMLLFSHHFYLKRKAFSTLNTSYAGIYAKIFSIVDV